MVFATVWPTSQSQHQGLPQGSVLAPILFLFYINTLAEILPEDTVNSLFADDISILATDSSTYKAQRKTQATVDIVQNWAAEFKMILSDKSEVTFFSTCTHEAKWKPTIHLGDSTLKFNPTPRLLGVFLDRTLSFGYHTDQVIEKVTNKAKMLRALAGTDWGWRKNDMKRVFNAHIKPVMDYAAHCWQPWISNTNMQRLEVAQNKCLRAITGQVKSSPVESLRAETGVCSYSTTSKRLTLIAKEKALRNPENHPSYKAVSETTSHRLTRSSFKSMANSLEHHLPEGSNDRLPIKETLHPMWDITNHKEVTLCPFLIRGSTKETPHEELKMDAMDTIKHHEANYTIYTDGSATSGTLHGGNAAVITQGEVEDPVIIEKITKKGSKVTCSYEEELEALNLATSWIEENVLTMSKVLICTDSQALCKALKGQCRGYTADLKFRLESLVPKIAIQWIPGHTNIPGNDLADDAAKDAANITNEDNRPISFGSVKSHIKRAIIDKPIKHERTALVYKDYNYKADLKAIKSRSDQTLLSRLRSGHHLSLRAYKHRIDSTHDPHCRHCPGEQHDLEHWLTRCTATTEARQRLFGTTEITTNYLVTHPKLVVEMARATLL